MGAVFILYRLSYIFYITYIHTYIHCCLDTLYMLFLKSWDIAESESTSSKSS